MIELWSGGSDSVWCWLICQRFRAFVLNYGDCVLGTCSTNSVQSSEVRHGEFRIVFLSCTSSLCVSPMITLHLWRLMEAWPCADISLLSFLSIAFIFSALLPHLSVSNSLFLSFTGQSGFVTLKHMCFCWGVFMYCVYDNTCTWELASISTLSCDM